jgi:tRNA-splicing ligase RtcB (3'-phosphate/5'-hydroxy nucleic acid ligase)
MQMIDNIPVYGTVIDEGALAQIKTCARTAAHVALMADHHKGYAVPIGGVVAYEDAISPSGVGFDIACGNKAVLTDADASDVKGNIAAIMNDIWRTISFGIGRKNDDECVDHDLFDDPAWSIAACKPLREMARQQLGTVGSGNHYVDIFEDELGRIWIGVHFGSRGLGHKTATWFLKAAGAKDGMDVEPCVLPVDSNLGAEYLEGMRLGGRYAYAGRDWVCGRVARILGAAVVEEIHNHHNFAWRESHGGRDLWVVRKGATPAFPGQRGFVGGSMGDISVIIEGVAHESTAATLCSTVHGAGRVMGRMEAKGKTDRKTGEVTRAGKVTPEMMREWVSRERVELRGAGVDESPHCYKRLPEVLAEHGESIRILHTLRPLGVAMAGEGEVDPYKD